MRTVINRAAGEGRTEPGQGADSSRSASREPELESRVRAALLIAIRHNVERTCGYCPADAEVEEAVAAGLSAFREGGEKGEVRSEK